MTLWRITIAVGSALILTAITLSIREHVWISRAGIAEGRVVGMAHSRSVKGKSGRAPTVSYRRADGSEHTFTRSYFTANPAYDTGERVIVAYDERSGEARIVRFGERFGAAAVLGAVGITLLSLGGSFFAGNKRVVRFYVRQAAQPLGTKPMAEFHK
jgi:hypothetical protein